MRFGKKGQVFKGLRQNPTFLKGLEVKEAQIRAIESEDGVFNAIAVLDKSEGSDLFFKREDVVIEEITTKYDSFKVLTYSVVGYDLIDSFKIVIFNITHRKALEYKLREGQVVFSSSELYKSLNDEETRVLKRQRALRHGNFSNESETTSEVEYAAENGYLSSFVENNGSEVWNWYNTTSEAFDEEDKTLYGFDSEIEAILELLRAEDNSLSSVTPIEAYLPSDTGFEHLKCSKSKYNTKDGVILNIGQDMLSDNQKEGNKLSKQIFWNAKLFNKKTSNKFEVIAQNTSSEVLIRAIEGVQYRTPVMRKENRRMRQMEASEAVFMENSLNLLAIAQNISTEAFIRAEKAEIKRLDKMGVYMGFITAKQYAKYLELTERQ